jgi:ABC-type dipeptide/oligopeptide/nickel transport system ATPase component
MSAPLLRVRLNVSYRDCGAVLSGCEFEVQPGECFALAGPSGSGKSTAAMAILRLLDPEQAQVSGELIFDGVDLLSLPEKQMRQIRGRRISLVPQSPLESLNPVLRIADQMKEAWQLHRPECAQAWKSESLRALNDVCLPDAEQLLRRYPRELSVGMAQRVLIAMAVLHRPRLLIADEATSALDVITQSGVLGLLRRLHREYGMSILFITHDLLAAASLCRTMAVLREGQIVECAPVRQIFDSPRHPDTRELVASLPLPAWELPAEASVQI